MKSKDYMVTVYDENGDGKNEESIFGTLAEARKFAKEESKDNKSAIINRWLYNSNMEDMYFDEHWSTIEYNDGKQT